jgi:hypothetical protein
MFFYLLNNSTFVTSSDKKRTYLNVIIYGSLLYILVHALFFLQNNSFSKLKYYFWIILILDVSILVFFEMNTVNHSMNDFFITNNTPVLHHPTEPSSSDEDEANDNDIESKKTKKKVKKKVTFENKSISLEDLNDMDITDTESVNINDSDFDMTDIDIDIDELSNELNANQ